MSARLLGLGFGCHMGTRSRKLILLKLIDACQDDGTRIFPAVETIALAAECSPRQVQRELAGMVAAGLLAVVEEGGGRGRPREYAMDVAMLHRIESEGWEAATAPDAPGDTGPDAAIKGDMASPFSEAERVTPQTERVTPATLKGDNACHPTPYRTLKDPSRRAQGATPPDGARELESGFWKLVRDWPKLKGMPKGRAMAAWRKLSDEDRQLAIDRRDAWLEALRAQGKTHPAGPLTYLAERLFDEVAPAAASGGEAARLAPWGKAWMAWRLHLLAGEPPRPWRPTASQQAMIDAGKGHLFDAARRRAEHPEVALLDEAAASRSPARLPAGAAVPEHGDFVQVRRGSPQWAAWEAWHARRDWPWIDPPAGVEWVWLPAQWPKDYREQDQSMQAEAGR